MELIQKKLFTRNIYTIKDTVLQIDLRSLFEQRQFTIPLDEINLNFERNFFTQHIFIPVFMIVIFMLIGKFTGFESEILTPLLWISVFLSVFIIAKNYGIVKIKTKHDFVIINAQSPSKDKVNLFLNTLIEKQKDHLKWKYGILDKDLDFDIQVVNFRKLRNMGILTDAEYEERKVALKALIKGE